MSVFASIRRSIGFLACSLALLPATLVRAQELPFDKVSGAELRQALVWTGHLSLWDGDPLAAIQKATQSWQAVKGYPRTETLSDDQASELLAEAVKKRDAVGWSILQDKPVGLSIGVPTRLVKLLSARAINGGYRVWEGFTELRFPFVNDKPGVYLLSMDAGYRYSSYTINNVTTNTYKLGLEYAPIQSVRLRSSYNRAVRAANLDELFEPPVVGSGGTADPCWGAVPTLSLAQCQRTGVTAAEYGNILANPAAQINTQVGGNIGNPVLDLEPPRANAIYVLEVSSYQIELSSGLSPDLAILTNLTPDHLTRRAALIAAVKIDDVRRLARRVLRDDVLTTVVVGKPVGITADP